MLTINCPGCEKKLRVQPALAGKRAKCPNCGRRIEIPAAEPKPKPSDELSNKDIANILLSMSTSESEVAEPEQSDSTAERGVEAASGDATDELLGQPTGTEDDQGLDSDEEYRLATQPPPRPIEKRQFGSHGDVTTGESHASENAQTNPPRKSTDRVKLPWVRITIGVLVLIAMCCPALAEIPGFNFEARGFDGLALPNAGFRVMNTWPGIIAAWALLGHLALLPFAAHKTGRRQFSKVLGAVAAGASLLAVYVLLSLAELLSFAGRSAVGLHFSPFRYGFYLYIVGVVAVICIAVKSFLDDAEDMYRH